MHNCCSRQHTGTQRDVTDLQFYQITGMKLVIGCKVEQFKALNPCLI